MSFTLFMGQSFLFISGDGGQKLNLSVSPNNSARGLFMHRETASLSSCGLRRTNETAEISVRQMFSSWIHVEDLGVVGDTLVTAQTRGQPFYCENQGF